MFVSLFSIFKVNLGKPNSPIGPHMKLEIGPDDVFFYRDVYFLYAKIIRQCQKVVGKTAKS